MRGQYLTCGRCGRQIQVFPDGDTSLTHVMARIGWVMIDGDSVCSSCRPTPASDPRMCDMCGVNPATTERLIGRSKVVEWLCNGCSETFGGGTP